MLRAALVGLANVGKSSLFNALAGRELAAAANFPFCTIEPNEAVLDVPDDRLQQLAACVQAQRIVPTQLQVVDVAGLVAGASEGKGLGTMFLGHIRQTHAIIHVVRAYEDPRIVHVSGGGGQPVTDAEVVELELQLADLAQIDRRRTRKTLSQAESAVLDKLHDALNSGLSARRAGLTETETQSIAHLGLLTLKPLIFAVNVAEDSLAAARRGQGGPMVDSIMEHAKQLNVPAIAVSARVEAELATLPPEEREAFLEELGLSAAETGLAPLVRTVYEALGLSTFFTAGQQEARAWTIKKQTKAAQAAGVIHSDFEKKFIRADTIHWQQLVKVGGHRPAAEAGLVRSEGRDYVVADGDVMLFRHG